MDTADPVLAELRKLREGPGLTSARLKRSGSVMSALGTSDPSEAMDRLLHALDLLDATERRDALSVDFGLDLERLLHRAPVAREREWLGERREAYAQVAGRGSKTLARWSDRMIDELRNRLLADTFDGHVYLIAAVRGRRILGLDLVQEPLAKAAGSIHSRQTTEMKNHGSDSSLPLVIYAFPRDWRPASITLAAHFLDEDLPPQVWAGNFPALITVPFGEPRHLLSPKDSTAVCRFENPRRDEVYVLWWS